jgi:molybdate transport system substrate-binding protein
MLHESVRPRDRHEPREVLPIKGTTFVGTIPAEVQYVTTCAGAVVAGSLQENAARRLLTFLASDGATAAIARSGMEPARGR